MKPLKLIGAAVALAISTTAAVAGSWTGATVQMVVPTKPGGGTDVMARIFADYLSRASDGNVVVVNQPAGGGAVAADQVLKANPDGMTLLFNHTGQIVNYYTGRVDINPEDLTLIGIGQSYPPQVYAVAPNASWNTMKDFVEDARANPGKLSAAVQLGGTSHFIAGLIEMNEGVTLKMAEAAAEVDKVAAIQGGFISIGNLSAGSARQYVAKGDMKVLGLLDAEPNPRYPEFVPMMQQGVNVTWLAPLVLWGPPGMDPALVAEINGLIAGMAIDPTAQDQLAKADSTFVYYDVPAATKLIDGENEKISALAKRLGLSAR
jgi:tripartite-type tricarboxylate transporter receptor subunit TctC